jgi:Flp pilus assembly protein TadG
MKMPEVQKGQALVEAALVFVSLVLMLSAFFDLGRAMVDYSILNNAVREGTRYAVVQQHGGSDSRIKDEIESNYFNAEGLDAAHIDISRPSAGGQEQILIHISYNFQPVTPIVKLIYPHGLNIDVQSAMFLTPNAK